MGLSWPSAYDWLWDKAQQYWPKADESGLRTAEQSFMAALPDVESAFSNLVSGHQDLVKALGESDSATAAQTKLADIQSRGETLNQIISAEFSMMNAAPQNIDTAKQGLIDKAKTADSNAKSGLMGFLAEYAPSVAQSQKEKLQVSSIAMRSLSMTPTRRAIRNFSSSRTESMVATMGQ